MCGQGGRIFGTLLRTAGLGRVVPVVVGGLVAAVVLAPVSASSWGGGSTGCGNSGCTTPFAVPLPIPQTLSPKSQDATTDYYTVTEQPANLSVIPGKTTPMWTYNGTWPGPVIKATSGRQVKLHVINNLSFATTTHLHGAHVAPSSDGGPVDLVPVGGTRDYVYPNNESARTQWYHDHVKDLTGKNVYMGLAGLYLISDAQEQALNLPSGAYDVPLVIQDRTFNTDGTLAYAPSSSDYRTGLMGDTLFVNGAAQPYLKVATHKYRFRILNGSNARPYELSLSNGQPFQLIATEGGLLGAPVTLKTLPVWPAERYEIVIDFSTVPVGTSVVLNNTAGSGSTAQVMRFDVIRSAADDSSVPAVLRADQSDATHMSTTEAAATVTRSWKFAKTWDRVYVINGKVYDQARIDAAPRPGDTEVWVFQNGFGWSHPVHVHLNNFMILDRNGTPPPPNERGLWKETAVLHPGETVRVLMRWPAVPPAPPLPTPVAASKFTNRYVFHCHNLGHEDHDMMTQFKVSPS